MKFHLEAIFVTLSLAPMSLAAEQIVVCNDFLIPPMSHSESPLGKYVFGPISTPVYEGLVEFVPGEQGVKPLLAEAWTIDQDDRRIEFTLREGVKFQDGSTFDAEDVVATYRYLSESARGTGAVSQLVEYGNLEAFAGFSSVRAIDSRTVVIETEGAASGALPSMARALAAIHPSSVIEEADMGRAIERPVGTGAYRLMEFRPREAATFEANPDYWGGAPVNERMIFREIAETELRARSVMFGECDAVTVRPGEEGVFSATLGVSVNDISGLGILSREGIFCYGTRLGFDGVSGTCMSEELLQTKGSCPRCPKSGACPQSIMMARAECCPKSGACSQ